MSGQSWSALVRRHQKNLRNTLWWLMRYRPIGIHVYNVFVPILYCLIQFIKNMYRQYLPFQGFLYVFGGLLDSAYTEWRCPLWVFDIGKFHCGKIYKVSIIFSKCEDCSIQPTKHVTACR